MFNRTPVHEIHDTPHTGLYGMPQRDAPQLVSSIVHWNTVYLGGATAHQRQLGRDIDNELIKHISPWSWKHINLTGIYSWDTEQQMPDGSGPCDFATVFFGPHDVHRMFVPSARF